MKNQIISSLPKDGSAYVVKNGEGERYLLGSQIATIIADAESTNHLLNIVVLAGGKGAKFPVHKHNKTHEGIFILDGRLELTMNGETYLLTSGDYAHIPRGTVHEYTMQSHRTRFLSFTTKGNLSSFYATIGTRYEYVEHPPKAEKDKDMEELIAAAKSCDIEFINSTVDKTVFSINQNGQLPDDVRSYVLEAGEGIRLLFGDQLQTLTATQKNTNGEFIVVVTEGPIGDRIVSHYHEKHTETFFCLQGRMTMWCNGEEIHLEPGDFLHCPPNTVHSYRLDSHYTKFVGILTPGIFEPFFRTLGDEYEDHIFPNIPQPLRFDRVMKKIHELDLKVVNPQDGE